MNFEKFIDIVHENNWELHGIEVHEKENVIAWYHVDASKRHPIYSATKSITSLVVGMAINEGKFDINESVYEYFFFAESIDIPLFL